MRGHPPCRCSNDTRSTTAHSTHFARSCATRARAACSAAFPYTRSPSSTRSCRAPRTRLCAHRGRYVTVYELARDALRDRPKPVRELVAGGLSSLVAQVRASRSATMPATLQTVAVPIDVMTQSLMLQGQAGHAPSITASVLARKIYQAEARATTAARRLLPRAGRARLLSRVCCVNHDLLSQLRHLVAGLLARARAADWRCDCPFADRNRDSVSQTPRA